MNTNPIKKWSTSKIDKLQNDLELFKSYRYKPISQANFEEAYKLCYLLFDIVPIIITEVNPSYILRARPNYNGEIFNEEHQISYNLRDRHKIRLGRFNRPYEPMFYASFPDQVDNEHFGYVAIAESWKDIYKEKKELTKQYFTLGKWKLNNSIQVLNLCKNDNFLNSNPIHKLSVSEVVNKIISDYPNDVANFIIKFWSYLSDLSCKNYEHENDYFLTTTFFLAAINYYKNEMGINISGAIYPSTTTENKGQNIVLFTDAADHFLKLSSVFMVKASNSYSNLQKIIIEQCTDEACVSNKAFDIIKSKNY